MNTKSNTAILHKFCAIFALLICIFAMLTTTILSTKVQAEGEIKRYYYITQNTILIPEGQSIKGNIQLRSTYYVQATGGPDITINDIAYRQVAYNGINGYVPSNALSKKSIDNVSMPYFVSKNKLTIQTTQEYVLMLFNISDDQINCRKLQNNTKLDFLAYSEDGKYILAKLLDGTVGYVPKDNCTPTVIFSPHPNPINPDSNPSLPNLSPDGNTDITPAKDNKATITRIILIVTLCVIVVVVIFLLFKPIGHKKTSKDDFYDF